MMNFFALCLVLTSLLAAEVWSPNPQQNSKQDVIVKEGHRVIVVETYDEGGHHNTKVSISPPQDPISGGGLAENAKEKIKQVFGQGISPGSKSFGSGQGHAPGELICDQLGKCTHKIATAIGKAKDQVASSSEKYAHEAKEVAQEAIDKKKEIAYDTKEKVEDVYEKTKEEAAHKAHEAKEAVEDAYEKAKERVKSAKDTGKTIGIDTATNVSKQVESLKESTEHSRTSIGQVLHRFFGFLGSREGVNTMMGVMNLVGFATAYGMCIWVTFISSHVLAGSLTRNQFGLVQSKIYPVYFRAMGYCILVALLGHIIGQRQHLFSYRKADILQVYNFLASILVVLINAYCLEPLATKVMFEKLRLEKEEGRGREGQAAETSRAEPPVTDISQSATTGNLAAAATSAEAASPDQQEIRSRMIGMNERLKKLNSCSSFLNMLTLMALSWHLVYLSQCIQRNCY